MPPRQRIIESVAEEQHGETACWHIITRAADGHGVTHIFPKVTLEWRAAEFGIDPTDVDTLLDMLLHEAFIDDAQDGPPTAMLAARSTAEAREVHAARISAVKAEKESIALDAKGGPLNVIRQRPGISMDGIRAKREAVDVQRWKRLYGALPVAPAPLIPSSSSMLEVSRA